MISLSLPYVTEVQQVHLPEGRGQDGNPGLSDCRACAFNHWAIQPYVTVICAFSKLCVPAAKGHSCPFSLILSVWPGSWITASASLLHSLQVSWLIFHLVQLYLQALCRVFHSKSSWCFQMREGDPKFKPVWAVHKAWENYQQRQKKTFSLLRTVFAGLHFPMWRAHFLLISVWWQNQGEWEQGYFIYPKQFIKWTQGSKIVSNK